MGKPIEELSPGCAKGELKAVFLDIDGTILNSHHEVTERTRTAIAQIKSQGIRVGIASGRPLFSVRELIAELNITDPCMLFSGALIADPISGAALHSAALDPELAKNALMIARDLNLHAELYTTDQYFIHKTNDYVGMHQTYLKQAPTITDQIAVIGREKVIKIVLVMEREKEEARFRAAMDKFGDVIFGLGFGAAHPNILFANMISKNADRVAALEKICQLYNVKPTQCASFGDADADLPFLTRVKYGVAMGNATPEVRAAAPFVTKHVDEDGVAFALDRLLVSPR